MPNRLDPLSKDFTGLEYKATPVEFKAEGDEGIFEGHFAVFGNVDDGGDIAMPGMFEKTLAENKHRVKVFYQHDWSKLIAPPPNTLVEDRKGLFAKGKLVLDSFWGNESWVLMKAGALTEGSFGFRTITDEINREDDGKRIRKLLEVKLFEISPVPLGMNPLTSVEAVKALLQQGLPLDQLNEGMDPLDLIAKNIEDMAKLIEQKDLLITADPEKAKEAAGELKRLSDGLLSVLAVEPIDHPVNHSALKLKAKSAELRLREIGVN